MLINSGNILNGEGQSGGNYTSPCNDDASDTPLASYVDWQLPVDFSPDDSFDDLFTTIMAHELGHQLTGREHVDDSGYCPEGFSLCNATSQPCYPLMCAGGGSNTFSKNNLSGCSKNEIQNRLDTRSCYQDYRTYPPNLPCPECDHELSLTPDQDYMVLNCGEETTTVNYAFDFCNYCALGEFDFTINLRNFSNINLIAPSDAPFTVTQGPFDTGILTIENVNLGVEECFSFEYALEYLAPNIYDSYTALISVDSTHLDTNSTQHLEEDTFILNSPANTFYSDAADDDEFEPINGRLSYLIGAGLMPPAESTGEQIRRRIIDDLIIDMDNISGADQYSITNTASILLMEPGTRIIVESGTLELRDTRIRGCDGMWGAIQVEDEDILLRKLANGTFQASRYHSALKYTGQRHLYKRLEQQSTPFNNWKLSFLNQAGSTPVGEYSSIDQSIKEALTLPDTIALSLAAQDSTLMEVMDELSGIDVALSAEPPTDTAALLLKRREILASLALQDSIAGNLRAAVQKEQQETLSLIEAANQNAPADSLYEANEQAFNTLAIKAAASIDSLSSSELSALFSLANQCPLSGGDAVFRARSLYHLVDPTYRFDNSTLCQPNAAMQAPKAAPSLDFKLFPNPTSGLTVLEFSTSIAGSVNVTLYSLQGQPVLQQTAGEGEQHILLETAALPGGTYFCRVTGVDGITGVRKLVKL